MRRPIHRLLFVLLLLYTSRLGAQATVPAPVNSAKVSQVTTNTPRPVYQDVFISPPAGVPVLWAFNDLGQLVPVLFSGTVSLTGTDPSGPYYINASGSGGGGLTSFTSGNLAPLFTTALGGQPLTQPALTFALSTHTANTVFAGPASGGAVAPTFRALVAADIPSLSYVMSVGMTVPGIMAVSGSPITSSGTLAVTLATQSANLVWAGPTTGSAATPTFRALVAADIPSLSYVTSVGLTLPAAILTVSGSPVTSSGTLSAVLATQTANYVWAGPTTGSAAAPTFRALVAADLPGGVGTVSSVALTMPAMFAVSGSPITTSGTLAVTLQTVSANTFLGGPSSAGPSVPTFRPLATADIPSLSYVTSVALTAPAIISVSGSPVTSSGTIALTLATQAENLVFAGPASGSAAAPTFRSLVAADIPSLSYVTSVALTVPAIFSVSGSPVTSSGTLAVSLATESANLVWAGPTTGSAANPTFRALVAADLPLATTGAFGAVKPDGTTITISAGVISSVGGGSGTVTSVGQSVPTGFTISGSPITGSGTLALGLSTETANYIWAGPSSGSAATPTFRAQVIADLPTAIPNANLANSAITIAGASTSLGGTITLDTILNAVGSVAQGDLLYYNGTHWVYLTPGTSGQLLETQGAGANPQWETATGTGTVTSVAMTVPTGFAVSGSPITTSGTLAVTLSNESVNSVFAGPSSGGSAAPTFRALVAGDIPAISLTAGVSGTLPIANGGTASTTALSAIFALTPSAYANGSLGATPTITWTNGLIQKSTLSANATITFSGASSGNTLVLEITNTASNYTVTWPTIKWVAGTAPTQTVGAHTDVYTIFYDGTNYFGNAVQNF